MSNPVITQTAPQWSAAGVGVNTLAIQPLNAGDLLVLAYIANGGPATAVTGGGAGTWQCASSYYDTAGSAYVGLWWATVTNPVGATGAGTPTQTVTVTDAGLGTNSGKIWVREFMAIGAHWQAGPVSPAAGSWQTNASNILYPYSARCLIGPAGAISLGVAMYVIYVKVTDSPEVPVLIAGYLSIQ